MNEKWLIGKGLFGLGIVAAYLVGILNLGQAIAGWAFLFSIDHIVDGVEIFKMKREMKKKEAGS
jgi:hypothetical protein